MCIYKTIFEGNEDTQERTALIYEDRKITYLQLKEDIKVVANQFNRLGFEPKERVLLYLPNCPTFITAFFATIYSGGCIVLADIKLKEELIAIYEENRVHFIITDRKGENNLRKVFKEYDEVEQKIITIDVIDQWLKDRDRKQLLKVAIENKQSDHAVILYTSGSTGRCKGVINTHATLEEALKNYINTVDITPNDKFMGVTPFFHSYCMGSCMFAALARRSTIVLKDKFQPRDIMNTIEEEKISIFQGVPYMYQLMIEHYSPQYKFQQVRYFISAGAALNHTIMEQFYTLYGKVICQEYGSTETGTMAINLSGLLEKGIDSVGKTLKGVQMRINDATDEGIGEIQIKSAGQAIGYLEEEPFSREWYATGDLGKIDDEGYIYIVGRIKRFINISGVKVNPYEVEEKIRCHPQVLDVMVKGVAHQDFGEVVQAEVVRKSKDLDEKQLKEFCCQHLALHKVPKSILFVDQIKKSGTGKNIL